MELLGKIKYIIKASIPPVYYNYKQARILKSQLAKRLGSGRTPVVKISWRKYSTPDDFVNKISWVFDRIQIDYNSFFIYPFDPFIYRQVPFGSKRIVSITPDFANVLDFDIKKIEQLIGQCKDNRFKATHLRLLDSIVRLVNRIKKEIPKSNKRIENLYHNLDELLNGEPTTFESALQKILFFDALFWQASHRHIGLGRLDKILYKYFINDIKDGLINELDAQELVVNFLNALNEDMPAKSMELIGDTGQYIMLGGVTEDGNVDNELTNIFLSVFQKYKKPDPKLILRVNNNTSEKVWNNAIGSLIKGNGSPLIMNERLVIAKMKEFGYDEHDLYELGTSACWEPLVIGKSFDQNNPLPNIISLKPLNDIIFSETKYDDFGSFLRDYKVKLAGFIKQSVHDISFDCSPLLTLFFDNCISREKDFSNGGARYSYHGIQIVSLPNTINTLLNIKYYVFDKALLTFDDCRKILSNNYDGYENIRGILKANKLAFGNPVPEVVELTNDIMSFIGKVTSVIKINGNNVKVGFSSSEYITRSKDFGPSLDGRKKGEPFGVHLSPISNQIGIEDILEFASSLSYEANMINGNVVDFVIPPYFMKKKELLYELLAQSCREGVFQIQLNAYNKDVLIDAKNNPEKYPDLIVRVWGFSAYFNDLPESYKDNMITRASLYES